MLKTKHLVRQVLGRRSPIVALTPDVLPANPLAPDVTYAFTVREFHDLIARARSGIAPSKRRYLNAHTRASMVRGVSDIERLARQVSDSAAATRILGHCRAMRRKLNAQLTVDKANAQRRRESQ